jgi:hypothetical protein
MFSVLIPLLTVALGLVFWWVKRQAGEADDPLEHNRQRYEQIDKDICNANSLDATAHATADLDELERLQRSHGDQRGSN